MINKNFVMCAVVFFIQTSLIFGMKRRLPEVSPTKKVSTIQPLWVCCSDNQKLPFVKARINQIKVLQLLLVHQKGCNSETNPINASMVHSSDLMLIARALDSIDNGFFKTFFKGLLYHQQCLLLNSSSLLQAQTVLHCYLSEFFPQLLQNKIMEYSKKLIVLCMGCFILAYRSLLQVSVDNAMIFFNGDGTELMVFDEGIKGGWKIADDSFLFMPAESLKDQVNFPLVHKELSIKRISLNSIAIQERITGKEVAYLLIGLHEGPLGIPVISADKSIVAVPIGNNVIGIWLLPGGKRIGYLKSRQSVNGNLFISPNGKNIIVRGELGLDFWSIKPSLKEKIGEARIKEIVDAFTVCDVALFLKLYCSSSAIEKVLYQNSHDLKTYLNFPDEIKNFSTKPIRKTRSNNELLLEKKIHRLMELWEQELIRVTSNRLKRVILHMTCLEKQSLKGKHNGYVKAIAHHPHEDILLSGGFDLVAGREHYSRNLLVSDVIDQAVMRELSCDQAEVSTIVFSPEGKFFVTGGSCRGKTNLTLYNSATYEKVNLLGHKGAVTIVSFSNDEKYLLSASTGKKNNVLLWDLATKSILHNFREYVGPVKTALFSPDGKKIISGGSSVLCVWDRLTGEKIAHLIGHDDQLSCISSSPDDSFFVSGSDGKNSENNLLLWDTKEFKCTALKQHTGSVTTIAVSADSRIIVSGSEGNNNNLCVWDSSGKLLHILQGHTDNVASVKFAHGLYKNMFVSGGKGRNNNLFLWDAQFGKMLYNITNDQEDICTVVFSPNNTKLISAGGNKYGDNAILFCKLNPSLVSRLSNLSDEHVDLLYEFCGQSRQQATIDLREKERELLLYNRLDPVVRENVQKKFGIISETKKSMA